MNFIESLNAPKQISRAEEDRLVGMMVSSIKSEVTRVNSKGQKALSGAFYQYYYDDMVLINKPGEINTGLGVKPTPYICQRLTELLSEMGFSKYKVYEGSVRIHHQTDKTGFFSKYKTDIDPAVCFELSW